MAPAASDCNENGFPDPFDISSGRSRDDNDDGIPDECVFCSLSTACGENNSCVSSRCVDGRCVVADLLYGDADRNGVLAEEDLDCVADGFALATRCAGADLFPCVADQDITMDDVLAAMEAFDGRDLCCE